MTKFPVGTIVRFVFAGDPYMIDRGTSWNVFTKRCNGAIGTVIHRDSRYNTVGISGIAVEFHDPAVEEQHRWLPDYLIDERHFRLASEPYQPIQEQRQVKSTGGKVYTEEFDLETAAGQNRLMEMLRRVDGGIVDRILGGKNGTHDK